MPNAIKYSTTSETLALRKGNFYIGTGDVGKGPTSTTGFWNALDVPKSGFNVYQNKTSEGPSIYSFSSQSDYLSSARVIAGIDFTGITQSLAWFATQSDKVVVNRDYEAITTNGLVLHVDAGYTPSYPASGNTIYNLGSSPYNGTLTNGPTFDYWGQGRIIFDGSDDAIIWSTQPVTGVTTAITYSMWFEVNSTSSNQALFSFRDSMITLVNSTRFDYWADVDLVQNNFTTSAITNNVWYHMALVQTGTTAFLYLNGQLQSSGTTPTIGTSRDAKAIGQYDSSPGAYAKLNGSVAVASIYNVGLTPAQILNIYDLQKSRFEFVTTWKTDNAGTSSSTQISLPLEAPGSYNMLVDWGDGTKSVITSWSDSAKTHTYSSAGTYTVKITGRCKNFNFADGGDKLKLLSVENWGILELGNQTAFWGCENLTSSDKFAPRITSTSLNSTFVNCIKFNGPVGSWNLKTVLSIEYMFAACVEFNQPLNEWYVSNKTNFIQLFRSCEKFNQDLGSWDVSNVTNLSQIFSFCYKFNNGGRNTIKNWNVSKVSNFSSTFNRCWEFDQDISTWSTPAATNMQAMFTQCRTLSSNFTNFITSGVTNMAEMFWQNYKLKSQRVSHFNTSNVTNLYFTFNDCTLFTGEGLENWNTSKVTDFGFTFAYSGFKSGVSSWDTRKATIMYVMFAGCSELVDDLSNWVTSGVTAMQYMFVGCDKFNSPIGSWDVSKNGSFNQFLFYGTSFNQPLGSWQPTSCGDFTNFMNGKSSANYTASYLSDIYSNWSQLAVQTNLTANFGTIKYTSAGSLGRAGLVANKGWTITDGGLL
jgi:surface protein